MTLIVNGTCESELRTMFWPRRLMYSETTGSLITLDWLSTCWEICFPMAICFSRLYQLPIPLAHPTLRFPIASMSLMLPSCGTFVAEGSTVFADGPFAVGVELSAAAGALSLSLSLSLANEGETMQTASARAALSD